MTDAAIENNGNVAVDTDTVAAATAGLQSIERATINSIDVAAQNQRHHHRGEPTISNKGLSNSTSCSEYIGSEVSDNDDDDDEDDEDFDADSIEEANNIDDVFDFSSSDLSENEIDTDNNGRQTGSTSVPLTTSSPTDDQSHNKSDIEDDATNNNLSGKQKKLKKRSAVAANNDDDKLTLARKFNSDGTGKENYDNDVDDEVVEELRQQWPILVDNSVAHADVTLTVDDSVDAASIAALLLATPGSANASVTDTDGEAAITTGESSHSTSNNLDESFVSDDGIFHILEKANEIVGYFVPKTNKSFS